MSYQRRLGADEGTILVACSICGIPYRYPGELKYSSDRLLRCLRTCDDPHIPQEEDRKNGLTARIREEIAPRFNVGVAPDWYSE